MKVNALTVFKRSELATFILDPLGWPRESKTTNGNESQLEMSVTIQF